MTILNNNKLRTGIFVKGITSLVKAFGSATGFHIVNL